MELSKDNVSEWKNMVSDIAEPAFGKGFGYAISDKELFEDYIGITPEDYVQENIEAAQ